MTIRHEFARVFHHLTRSQFNVMKRGKDIPQDFALYYNDALKFIHHAIQVIGNLLRDSDDEYLSRYEQTLNAFDKNYSLFIRSVMNLMLIIDPQDRARVSLLERTHTELLARSEFQLLNMMPEEKDSLKRKLQFSPDSCLLFDNELPANHITTVNLPAAQKKNSVHKQPKQPAEPSFEQLYPYGMLFEEEKQRLADDLEAFRVEVFRKRDFVYEKYEEMQDYIATMELGNATEYTGLKLADLLNAYRSGNMSCFPFPSHFAQWLTEYDALQEDFSTDFDTLNDKRAAYSDFTRTYINLSLKAQAKIRADSVQRLDFTPLFKPIGKPAEMPKADPVKGMSLSMSSGSI